MEEVLALEGADAETAASKAWTPDGGWVSFFARNFGVARSGAKKNVRFGAWFMRGSNSFIQPNAASIARIVRSKCMVLSRR